MKLSAVFFGILSVFCSVFAYAGDMGPQTSNYFIAVSGGPSWTNEGTYQLISLQPNVLQAFVPTNLTNSNLLGNGELFIGKQFALFPQIDSQFGVDLYLSSYAKMNGFVEVDGNLNLLNYAYQYKINHGHIAAKTKWIFENDYHLNPYLSASVGVGFNRSYDFLVMPLIFQEIPAPPFRSNTQTAFSYTVGAGFQYTINPHFAASVGYQLVSWGSSNLDSAVGQTLGKGLSLSNLYTQGLEVTISYFL